MSLDVQSELPANARVVEMEPQVCAFCERVEGVLLILASGLAAIVISTIWVSLSLG